jgi:hypothetical protein
MQFGIGEFPYGIGWLIGLPNNGCLVGMCGKMAVDTIFGNVELCTLEPFYLGLSKIPIQYLVPLLAPGEIFGYVIPK